MTPSYLDRLEKLAEAATPGPWNIGYKDGSGGVGRDWPDEDRFCISDLNDESVFHARLSDNENDAAFIAESRTAIPELVRRLRLAISCLRDYECDECGRCGYCLIDELEAEPK